MFGVIRMAYGTRAKLLFRFVWPETYEEVVLDRIDWCDPPHALTPHASGPMPHNSGSHARTPARPHARTPQDDL